MNRALKTGTNVRDAKKNMMTYKTVRGWNLTNLSYVCHHIFLSIAQIGPCFQGPIHG